MQISNDNMNPIEKQRYLPSYSHYDPYRVPPNLAQSVKHYECTMFGNDDYGSQTCPCCRQLQKMPLWFSCPLSHIQTVSHSACYYFHFVLNMILLSFLVFVVNGIINLIKLFKTCGENSQNCVYVYGVPFRKPEAYFDEQHYIMDSVTILLLFLFHLYTSYQFKRLHFFQRYRTRASDYSIMLSCVDHKKVTPNDLITFFRGAGATGHIEVLYTHQIKAFIKAERLKCQLRSELAHRLYHKSSEATIVAIQNKIKLAEDKMLPTVNTFYFNQEQTIRTDKVFVTFNTRQIKQDIVRKFKTGQFKRILRQLVGHSTSIGINDCHIILEESAEPNEILWQNLQVTNVNRYLRIAVSNSIAFLLLLFSFGLITLLSYQEVTTKQQNNYLSYICAIIISIVNLAISYSLEATANKECRITVTGKLTSLMTKQTLTFFFNAALIPFSMFFIFKSKDGADGFILTIITIFFMNAFVNPFLLLVNIESIVKYFKRKRLLKQDINAMLTTQSQSNQIFQKPSFELQFKYSVISKMMMMTVFYAAVFPLGSLFAIISLIANYYVNKYMLLRHCQIFRVSFKIGRRINKLNSLLPSIYGLGILTNQYLIKQTVTPITIIIFCISIVLTLINFLYSFKIVKYFYKRWVKSQALLTSLTHQQAIDAAGILDYKHLNPTSCQEVKHQDLRAPAHSGEDFIQPKPISPSLNQKDDSVLPDRPETPKYQEEIPDKFAPGFRKIRTRPSLNTGVDANKNRFLRSMTLYAAQFPRDNE